MSLFGRDANGADAYIRASGTSGSGVNEGLVTFHDTFTNDLKFKAQDLTASADVIPLVASTKLRVMSITLMLTQLATSSSRPVRPTISLERFTCPSTAVFICLILWACLKPIQVKN